MTTKHITTRRANDGSPAAKRAAELFRLRGGESLERALRLLESTLDVYEQDLARARADSAPEKFRWRVKPAEAMRALREQQRIAEALAELRASCEAECAPAQDAPAAPEVRVAANAQMPVTPPRAAQHAPQAPPEAA